jgi:thiamine pyrophosphate-dependent acetolactate synthase large subunit-like protein
VADLRTIGDLLRDVSPELAREFGEVEVPAALEYTLRPPGGTVAVAASAVGWPHGRVRTVVLAGPDVLRDPIGLGIRRFAEAANVPVANTWGAKGVFNWDSPHHMGTCGLQADDFALLGFADFELIVATGIDPLESPEERFGLAPVVHISPLGLAKMVDVPRLNEKIPPNDLYGRIAGVAQPGYVDNSFPRHPARAVMDLKQSLDPDTIVFGQPGPAGLWLARTFPTDRPGSICVPSVSKPGIAAALALAATCQGKTAVAATTGPVDAATGAVVDAAPDAFRLEVWGDDVDWSHTQDLVEAAGPVVAWT